MSDVLAIAGEMGDEELVELVASRHPTRVTVLVPSDSPTWAHDESPAGRRASDRLAALLAAIERVTGATVVGIAGSRAELLGWRFDVELGGRPLLAA